MSEYFTRREEAEEFLRDAKDYGATFFGKVLNEGTEKWMVSYHTKDDIVSSPYIRILADHSGEIQRIVKTA